MKDLTAVRSRDAGQAMMEYVIVCAALALILGIGMVDHTSVLWELINSFQAAYKNFSFAISLPG